MSKSKKNRYKGLKFNYKIGNQVLNNTSRNPLGL
jgi:hypothetical protein